MNRTYGARPGPQAEGAAAVPRTRAKAPAGGRTVALDGAALIERDRQRSEAAHRAKTDGKIKSVLFAESSEGGLHKTATTPPAAEKNTTVAGGKTETTPTATPQTADEKSSTADEGYSDEMYAADEKAYLERMAADARARGVFRCACGCTRAGDRLPAVWREVRRGLTKATPLHAV